VHWVVWLLVCGIVVGVMCIGLCGCWCEVSGYGSSELGCIIFGVRYRGGGHVYWVVWLLVCCIVLGVI